MAKTKFRKQPGESVILKWEAVLMQEEASVGSVLTGKYAKRCKLIITNERLAATAVGNYGMWGLIVIIIIAMTNRSMYFEIPSAQLASATYYKPRQRWVFETTDGRQYSVAQGTVLSDSHSRKVIEALSGLAPRAKTQVSEEQPPRLVPQPLLP